jgi:endonuclease/exonuclease/phosphatase (EEP) superfamily protein YafD
MIFDHTKVRNFSFSPIKFFFLLFQLIASTTIIGSISVLMGKDFPGLFGWLFEIASNFPVQYLAVQLIAFILALSFKHNKLAIFWAVFILLNTTQISTLFLPANKNNSSPEQIFSFLQMNLLQENNSYTNALAVIKKYKPDLLCCEEYSSVWHKELSKNLSEYPHRFLIPVDDWFGLALYSKFPIAEAKEIYFTKECPRALVAKITIGKNVINTICLHTLSPSDSQAIKVRNEELSAIAQYAKSINKIKNDSLIIAGDFNCSPWCYYFKNLLKEGNLFNSQQGFGIQNSWPTKISLVSLLAKVPIDHFLLSKNISVLDRQIGPSFNSDHYPVFVKLAMSK